jgi:hypothetical protein
MSGIIGIPIRFRIIIEGEVNGGPGMTDAHVHSMIQNGLSFSASLASANQAMSVTVAKPGEQLKALPKELFTT